MYQSAMPNWIPSAALTLTLSGLAAFILFTSPLAAQAVTQEELESFAEPHGQMSNDVQSLMDANPGEVDERAREQAEAVVRDSRDPLEQGLREHFDFDREDREETGDKPSAEIVVYVSSTLPDSEISDAVQALEGIDSVRGRVVYRGIEDGEKLGDFAQRARRVVGELDVEKTSFELDPTRFRASTVTAVPRMEYRDEDGDIVAAVDGLSNPMWLMEQIDQGERGELGTRGPVREIAERDLIELMKERFLALDLEAERDRTIETFWDRIAMERLAAATETKTRRLNPAIRIPKAITAADGEVIHPAGTIINPLLIRDFTRRLLIINPTRQAEREWLKNRPERDLKDIVMITDIDRAAGWDGYVELQDDLGESAFLLTPDVRQRFQIQATPTQVTAEDGRFVVREYRVDDPPNDSETEVSRNAEQKE